MDLIYRFDNAILDFFQNVLKNPFWDKFFILFTKLGDSGVIWIMLGIILIVFKKTRYCGILVLLSLGISALVANIIIKPIFERPRPFAFNESFELLIPKPHGEFSFPSGHTTTSFASAMAVFLHNKKIGIPALVIASIVAISRLYLYVHFPTDILVGAMLGIITAIIVKFFADKVKAKIV